APRDDASGQIGKIAEIATVERDFGNLLMSGNLSSRAGLRVQSGSRSGDADTLSGAADFQRDINPQDLIHRQGESCSLIGAETFSLGLQRIATGVEIGNREIACLVREAPLRDIGVEIRYLDGGARYYRGCGIRHATDHAG